MIKRPLWLATWLCLASWCASACGEVESCSEHVTPGCNQTAPRDDGSCLLDLVLRGAKCVKPGSVDDHCASCAEGTLCVPELNQCSAGFCEVPAVLPGTVTSPAALFCEAQGSDAPLGFEEVCKRRCQLRCALLGEFCPGYACPDGSCDAQETQDRCSSDCPALASGASNIACIAESCNEARFSRCSTTLNCPLGITPSCADKTCTNDCAFSVDGEAVVGDGICDDGDVLSAASPYCAWGTDCADCGPRAGLSQPAGAYGDLCQWARNCAGATGNPSTASAWCVLVDSTRVSRCAPDCSRGQPCPAGFGCFSLSFDDPTTKSSAGVIEGDYTSSACLPLSCG